MLARRRRPLVQRFLRPTARAAAGMMRPVIGHTRTGRVAVIRALWDVQTRLVAVVIAASVVHTALQQVIPQGPGPAPTHRPSASLYIYGRRLTPWSTRYRPSLTLLCQRRRGCPHSGHGSSRFNGARNAATSRVIVERWTPSAALPGLAIRAGLCSHATTRGQPAAAVWQACAATCCTSADHRPAGRSRPNSSRPLAAARYDVVGDGAGPIRSCGLAPHRLQ